MFFLENENFLLFLDNLSVYHVFFDFISFLAFLTVLWYCRPTGGETQTIPNHEIGGSDDEQINELFHNLKTKRQKQLLGQVSSNLSQNELDEEKRMERMQLEKIFALLREQEDKFQVTSMEQVQDQLSLYR